MFFFRLYDLYSFNVIPVLGELISKDKNAYQYLVESIRTFPSKVCKLQSAIIIHTFTIHVLCLYTIGGVCQYFREQWTM